MMPKRAQSVSAALFAFGLFVCLSLGVSGCSSGSEDIGSSEQIEADRTQSPAHRERTREMEDRNEI